MNLDQVRVKFFRRILSPVEIIYDLTTHWFIILLALSIATLIAVAKVTSEPPLYEAKATLVLKSNDLNLDDSRRPSPPRDAAEAFIGEQLSLLRSDSVIQKVVDKLDWKRIISQEEPPESYTSKLGHLQKFYKAGEKLVIDALSISGQGSTVDRDQAARATFRRISDVITDRKSNIVTLKVYGTSPDDLITLPSMQKQGLLDTWIQAYRERIGDISKETYTELFEDRIEYWTKKVDVAFKNLEAYRLENPIVNPDRKKFNDERLIKLHMYLEDFIRGLPVDSGRVASLLTPGGGPSPEELALTELRRKKAALELEMASLKVKYAPGSDRLKEKQAEIEEIGRMIGELEQKLESIRNLAQEDAGKKSESEKKEKEESAAAQASSHEAKVQEWADGIRREIATITTENSMIDAKMPTLNGLIEEHKRAYEILNKFRSLKDETFEQSQVKKAVDVVIQDKPVVLPYNRGSVPQRVSLATLAGLGIGLVLAFSREFFSRKIRYKGDIEDELGLKVVGVIPEN